MCPPTLLISFPVVTSLSQHWIDLGAKEPPGVNLMSRGASVHYYSQSGEPPPLLFSILSTIKGVLFLHPLFSTLATVDSAFLDYWFCDQTLSKDHEMVKPFYDCPAFWAPSDEMVFHNAFSNTRPALKHY